MNVLSPYCTVTTSIYLYFSKLESRNEPKTKAGKLKPKQLLLSRQQHTAPKNTPPYERGFCFLCVRGWFLLLYPPQGDPTPASRRSAEAWSQGRRFRKGPEGSRSGGAPEGSAWPAWERGGPGTRLCGMVGTVAVGLAPWRWGGHRGGGVGSWQAAPLPFGGPAGRARPQGRLSPSGSPETPEGCAGQAAGRAAGQLVLLSGLQPERGLSRKSKINHTWGCFIFIF